MRSELAELVDILSLEQIELNLFRGTSPTEGWQRVYGGQVLGQALVAASRTVDGDNRSAHSLHGYFLRPGDTSQPILYSVDRIRDGRSFTTRRVVAIQNGVAIFSMSASFQVHETGLSHADAMPDVPPPENCEPMMHLLSDEAGGKRSWPIDMRSVEPVARDQKPTPQPPVQHTWVRTVGEPPDDLRLNQCVLAYASDMTLLDTSYRPHGVDWTAGNFQVASLDHAMWFHRPFQLDDWLLYAQDSPNSGGGRGFSRGTFFSRSGELIASGAQEGLIRLHAN